MQTTPEELAAARDFHEAFGNYPEPVGDEFDLYFEITSQILWPKVWLNPGLDARTRSLCVVAALTALGRPQVGKHIRAALANGVTKDEIGQLLGGFRLRDLAVVEWLEDMDRDCVGITACGIPQAGKFGVGFCNDLLANLRPAGSGQLDGSMQ